MGLDESETSPLGFYVTDNKKYKRLNHFFRHSLNWIESDTQILPFLHKCHTEHLGKTAKEKNVFLLDIVQKGGGQTGIQKFWGKFVFPHFDPLLDIKWSKGGGLTMLQTL